MGRASVVDLLIGDPNSLHNSISNISIEGQQPNSDHYPLIFKICHESKHGQLYGKKNAHVY